MEKTEAIERLRLVNSHLTFYMKEKRALQNFIQEENDREKGIASPRSKAWELRNDEDFVKEHGRVRTTKEIALLMNYSERQVQRFLQEKN